MTIDKNYGNRLGANNATDAPIGNFVSVVLDASALLAFLHNEPGADKVDAIISDSLISTVNWSEVVQKSLYRATNPPYGATGITAGQNAATGRYCRRRRPR